MDGRTAVDGGDGGGVGEEEEENDDEDGGGNVEEIPQGEVVLHLGKGVENDGQQHRSVSPPMI